MVELNVTLRASPRAEEQRFSMIEPGQIIKAKPDANSQEVEPFTNFVRCERAPRENELENCKWLCLVHYSDPTKNKFIQIEYVENAQGNSVNWWGLQDYPEVRLGLA